MKVFKILTMENNERTLWKRNYTNKVRNNDVWKNCNNFRNMKQSRNTEENYLNKRYILKGTITVV